MLTHPQTSTLDHTLGQWHAFAMPVVFCRGGLQGCPYEERRI